MKIGVFGGVFNPIHNGHLFLAEVLKKELGLDDVIFIPCGEPSHKRNPEVSGKHRLDMVKLAVGKRFRISAEEIILKGKSYTIDTLERLKECYCNEAKLYLLIGADNIKEIKTWKNYPKIFRLAKVVAISRPGSVTCDVVDPIRNLKVRVIKSPSINISSSLIRKRLKKGEPVRYLVPDKVLRYIEKNQLYR